jgi:ATP-dependent helicase/nuclease subunit B
VKSQLAGSGARLYTIGADFAASLAEGLLRRAAAGNFSLADCVIFLPTRRAARGFGEIFAKVGGGAVLLPQFRALGEIDEESLPFDEAALTLPPAIAPTRRLLLLASLIGRWRGGRSFAEALTLAGSLAAVMDEAEREQVDISGLGALLPADLAQHWQEVADFLSLLQTQWPSLLAAENAINPADRRNRALKLAAEEIVRHPPPSLVIAAGSTGSIPANADLMAAIAGLPNGAVILPGLDRGLDAESWERLDPGHPQFGLKQLLTRLGAGREMVRDWDGAAEAPRQSLLREALRPAPTTDAWRALAERPAQIAEQLRGLAYAPADHPREEALVIALALRETLEHPGRTAALVTPDRALARRVIGELSRWEISIDDSAGRPLAHTAAGAFLCLLAEAAEAKFAPVPLLALLKHPFATLGGDAAPFRSHARALDRALRGPRPDAGLAGIAAELRRRGARSLLDWWHHIAAILQPLEQAYAKKDVALAELIAIHVAAAEALACREGAPCPLWRGPDGEAASAWLADLSEAAHELPPVEPTAYADLIRRLAMGVPVRPRQPVGQAIAILGPLEARLQHFDLTILGGLNETVWPASADTGPWFSRPMRERLGLPQPERATGLAAHDFAMLAGNGEVLLTRALKQDGAPTIASRWLQRLLQLTQGLGLTLPESPHLALARSLAEAPAARPVGRPAPAPPVASRPRRLTVTEIETWLRDPYAIYAKHVLGLRPLDPLDDAVGALERGSLFHKSLEIFVGRHPGPLPESALPELVAIAEAEMEAMAIPHAQRALWRPRFAAAARAFIAWEQSRRSAIAASHLEVRGKMIFDAPAGPFELACIADRIDVLKRGGAAVVDYKTGSLPHNDAIVRFLTPQLPLEAAILARGGFAGLPALIAEELIYLRFAGKGDRPQVLSGGLAVEAEAKLKQRIAWFDHESTPYHSRIAPQQARLEGDYDHLARVKEWAPFGWSDET